MKMKDFMIEVREVIESQGVDAAELHIVETYDWTPETARAIIAQIIDRGL